MPIDPTTSTTGASALGGAQSKKEAGFLGKEDFLKLLVAQLKNQDPSNAQDMDQMTQQMTQFSMLEQLTNLAESTQSTNVSLAHSHAVELIGKSVSYMDVDGSTKQGVVEKVNLGGDTPTLTIDGTDGHLLAEVVSVG